jgi:hypothetical protein
MDDTLISDAADIDAHLALSRPLLPEFDDEDDDHRGDADSPFASAAMAKSGRSAPSQHRQQLPQQRQICGWAWPPRVRVFNAAIPALGADRLVSA